MRCEESATTWQAALPGGGWGVCVEHATLSGITPAMLAWWYRRFAYLDVSLPGGRTVSAYRLWHPFDHRDVRVAKHSLSGQLGYAAGAELEFGGCWGRIERKTRLRIRRLDMSGLLAHLVADHKVIGAIEESFSRVRKGTRCESVLTLAPAQAGVRPLPETRRFNAQIIRAWIRHKIEEIGNLQRIVPALYAEAGCRSGFEGVRIATSPESGGES